MNFMENTLLDIANEEIFNIRYSDMDYDLVLKPSALLGFMQDIASDNAEKLGFGYSTIVKKNLAWFLLKYRIEFIDYPKNLYNITIRTYPRGANKIFAYRDFEILYNDNIIAKATSTWTLVDINTKSMANIANSFSNNPYLQNYEKKENDLIYSKIPEIKEADKEKTFEIRFDDLDVNFHVNNTNYIVWAFEPLDFDFRKKYKLKNLDMVFKKEIKYGNTALSLVKQDNTTTYHTLKNKNTNEDLCFIKASEKI